MKTTGFRRLATAVRHAVRLVGRSGRWLSGLAAVIGTIGGLLIAVELVAIRSVVDGLTNDSPTTAALLLFGSATTLRRVSASIGNELQWLVAERVERSVLADVLDVATQVPYAEFEAPEFQDRLKRALAAGQQDVWGAAWGLLRLLTSSVTVLTLVVVLAALAPDLILPFLIAAFLLGGVAVVKSRLSYTLDFDDTQPDRERRYLREAVVSRSEGKEIRLFGTRDRLLSRHDALFAERLSALLGVVKRRIAIDATASAGLGIVVVGCLIIIADRTSSGSLDLADAAVAAVTANQLASSLSTLSNGASSVLESARRVGDLESFVAHETPSPPVAPFDEVLSISLDGVSFRYPDSAVDAVHDVSLRINRGELVALVGENGSGKSTIAKLAAGLYSPDAGHLVVSSTSDEQSAWAPTSPLTGHVSAVFQDFARYELSVADNLDLGRSEKVTHSEVEAALEATGLRETVDQLAQGIETRLGRRFGSGVDLSLGQWQRLAIARAVLSPAPFVILDEPSASLDPRIEAELFNELRSILPGRGILLISHRFGSVIGADEIIVLNDGKVAERGSHADLTGFGGLYAAMFNVQADRFVER